MDIYNQEALKKIRKAKDLNQQALAAALEIPVSTYSLKEREGTFTENELKIIYRILRITKEDIFLNGKSKETIASEIEIQQFLVSKITKMEATLDVLLSLKAIEDAVNASVSPDTKKNEYSNLVKEKIADIQEATERKLKTKS